MESRKPAKAVKDAVEAAAEKVADALTSDIPVRRAAPRRLSRSRPRPHDPLPPKTEQGAPETRTPTGAETGAPTTANGQQGAFLTTVAGRPAARHRPLAQGRARAARSCCRTTTSARRSPTSTTSASRSGSCTPAAPARTACSPAYGTADGGHPGRLPARRARRPRSSSGSPPCSAPADRPTRSATPAASRRSSTPTRAPSTWSATTSRSSSSRTRIKFPDIIHAGKPHPDREIPQAQSAHDTFWDFVSLHTEAQHHTMWNMSDRGIPRSYRTMEGFGVHTFRLVNDGRRDGAGQVPLEAQAGRALPGLGGGADAQRHRPGLPPPRPVRRDRGRRVPRVGARASRSSRTPRRRRSPGIDLLDPTKIVPGGAGAGAAGREAGAQPDADELLRRDRAGRLPPRPPAAGHRRHQRPAAAGPAVLVRRHAAHPAGRAELLADPDQPPTRAGQRHAARRLPPARRARRGRAVPAELARRRQPVPGRRRRERVPRRAGDGGRGAQGPRRTRRRSTTTSARPGCSG